MTLVELVAAAHSTDWDARRTASAALLEAFRRWAAAGLPAGGLEVQLGLGPGPVAVRRHLRDACLRRAYQHVLGPPADRLAVLLGLAEAHRAGRCLARHPATAALAEAARWHRLPGSLRQWRRILGIRTRSRPPVSESC